MEDNCTGKIACVTGSPGFVGQHLVRALLSRGWKVRRLLRRNSPRENAKSELSNSSLESLMIGDKDYPDLRDALDGASVFFNLAGVVRARSEGEFFKGNVEFTKKIVKSVERDRGAHFQRFIHISSLAARGPSKYGEPLDENAQASPVGCYARSKLEGEKAVLEFAGKMPLVILRPCAVYGPGDLAFLELFRIMRLGIAFYPSGDFQISLVHVEDLVDAILKATVSAVPSGSIYNISGEGRIRLSELASILADFYGRHCFRVPLPAFLFSLAAFFSEIASARREKISFFNSQKVQDICGGNWLCDNSKAKKELDFKPAWEIEAGLRSTFDWYIQNGWI